MEIVSEDHQIVSRRAIAVQQDDQRSVPTTAAIGSTRYANSETG